MVSLGQPYVLKITSTNFADDTIFVELLLFRVFEYDSNMAKIIVLVLGNKLLGKRNALFGSKLLFDFVFLLCHK